MIPKLLLGDRADSAFTPHWLGMGTASFIVMTNAVRYWRDWCDEDNSGASCKLDMFAFILGALGGLVAIFFMYFHHEMLEQGMSVLFFLAWCFGIAYLTFPDGPATFTGTSFFAVWAAFLFSLNMSVVAVKAVFDKMLSGNETTNDGGETATPGEGTKEPAVQEATAKHDEEEAEKEETAAGAETA
jgi:hypothetical protein